MYDAREGQTVVRGMTTLSTNIGFYGCRGRVVRLGFNGSPRSRPRDVRLTCPGCGHEHTAKPFWRKSVPGFDDGKELTLVDE